MNPEPPLAELESPPAPAPVVLRVLSGIGAIFVFLIALLFTLGTVMAAPIGMMLVRNWARRHDRRPTLVSSLVGAVMASCVAVALLGLLVVVLVPSSTWKEIQKTSAESQSQETVKAPDWYQKMFPQTSRVDSATQQLVQSPGFAKVTLVFTFLTMTLFFGALAGASGWAGTLLLSYAGRGRILPA